MTVNGEALHYKLDPETPLLWALREASNLTGTKYGCDSGDCGACTVIIDGRAVPSCSVSIASLEGADITTIEGLSADRAHPIQQAWAAEQVSQCGADSVCCWNDRSEYLTSGTVGRDGREHRAHSYCCKRPFQRRCNVGYSST